MFFVSRCSRSTLCNLEMSICSFPPGCGCVCGCGEERAALLIPMAAASMDPELRLTFGFGEECKACGILHSTPEGPIDGGRLVRYELRGGPGSGPLG